MSSPTSPRVRAAVTALPGYVPGRPAPVGPGGASFKISSNENPFDPLPGVVAAVRDAVAFNRYPDALAGRLRARLAERFGVTDDRIHIAAGSVSIPTPRVGGRLVTQTD